MLKCYVVLENFWFEPEVKVKWGHFVCSVFLSLIDLSDDMKIVKIHYVVQEL